MEEGLRDDEPSRRTRNRKLFDCIVSSDRVDKHKEYLQWITLPGYSEQEVGGIDGNSPAPSRP